MSLWLVFLVASATALIAGGIFWSKEWAVTDPKLKAYALEFMPSGAELVRSQGERCNASNGWDRFYRPQNTCHEIFWVPAGDVPQEERLEQTLRRAADLGWLVENSPHEGRLLRREGYNAVVRAERDELLDRCRAAPPDTRFCGDFVVVRTD